MKCCNCIRTHQSHQMVRFVTIKAGERLLCIPCREKLIGKGLISEVREGEYTLSKERMMCV